MATAREQIAAAKAAQANKPTSSAREQIAAAKAAQAAPEAQAAAPEDQSNWIDRVNALGQGMSFGFADEAGSAIAALAAKTLGGSDEAFGDIYDQMMQSEQNKRKVYAEAHPKENMLLNIAGGIGSGGVGLAKTVGKLASGTLKEKAIKAAATGVGGALEGGVAGAGSADQGKRLEGAGEGAAWGGGGATVLGGLGKAARAAADMLSKRRVDRSLVSPQGNFTPLNIADEGWLGNAYRNLIGRAYGGGDITKQSKDVVRRADANLKSSDDELVSKVFRDSTPNSFNADDLDMSNPDAAFEQLNDAWKTNAFSEIKGSRLTLDEDELISGVLDQMDDPALRDYSPELIKDLKYYISPNLKREMIDPPKEQAFKSGAYGDVKPVPATASSRGEIDGEELLNARNKLRMEINAAGNEPKDRLKKAAYSKTVEQIDKIIRPQLSDVDLAAFDADLSGYRKFNILADAKSRGARTGEEAFTPKQLQSAATVGKGREAAEGTVPFQQEARAETVRNAALTKAAAKARERTPPQSSGIQQAIQTSMLGGPLTALSGLGFTPAAAAATAPLGAATANILARPNTQRILAGQTAPQEAAAKALREYKGSGMQDVINAISTGTRRGSITADDNE